MDKLKKPTLEDFIRSMEGQEMKYGEPIELIWRLARTLDGELDEMYRRIEELRADLGL